MLLPLPIRMQRRDSRLPVPDPSVPHCHENLTVSCSIAATVLPTRFTALLRPVLPSTTTLPPAFHTSNKRHALKFTHTKANSAAHAHHHAQELNRLLKHAADSSSVRTHTAKSFD